MEESLKKWIPALVESQPQGVEAFIRAVQPRLLAFARSLIHDVPMAESDEEDVVNAALHSFLWRAADQQFQLHDEDDLWKVVHTIVSRKALNHRRRQGRRREHGAGQASLGRDERPSVEAADPHDLLAELIEREVVEQLMKSLGDPELERIAQMKLERHTNLEIATAIGRSLATVERRLRMIRTQLQATMDRGAGSEDLRANSLPPKGRQS